MATANTERRCPTGRHVMDPNWDDCPYCGGEKRSHQQTAFRKPEIIKSAGSRDTIIGSSMPDSSRKTKQMQENAPQPSSGGKGGSRRIVGILITYSWQPHGDLFPIREGKNYIGAGNVSREPGDPKCDIFINDDPQLSSAHALILCRNGRFEIVDLETTNGTFIEDDKESISRADLPDKAIIKTGSTEWTFMKIEPVKGFETPTVKPPPGIKDTDRDSQTKTKSR